MIPALVIENNVIGYINVIVLYYSSIYVVFLSLLKKGILERKSQCLYRCINQYIQKTDVDFLFSL